MSDYSELKRLAEAANAVKSDVNITMAVGTTQEEVKAVQDFLQLAMPKTILALIAENERLCESDQESTELCDTLSFLLGEIAVAVRGPEEPKSRHGFHDLPSRVKTVVAERDQLKAENEVLRNSLDALSQSREDLIGQGRNFALVEASHLCFRTAFVKYYPAGTRYKLFTPKMQKAVGDALVEVANLIAELPDGPYQRYAERQTKLAAIKESGQ